MLLMLSKIDSKITAATRKGSRCFFESMSIVGENIKHIIGKCIKVAYDRLSQQHMK